MERAVRKTMKVWIDILTPKQALFFEPLIKELDSNGHAVFVTSRKYREVELMIRMKGIKADFLGAHGGKSLLGKLTSSVERIRILADRVNQERPDAAVSFSSPEGSRVAFGLGIKNFCVNDSPHAEAVARLTIPLCHRLFTPWMIATKAWTKYGIDAKRITKYRALDPAAWLKRIDLSKQPKPEIKLDDRKTIVVRLEESFAAYLLESNTSRMSQGYELLKKLLQEFPDCNIVALGRYAEQIGILQKEFGNRLVVPTDLVDGFSLLRSCDLFIGMGGTMTAEAALLGVPAISYFRGSYDVEKFLLSKGLIVKPDSISAVIRTARKLLKDDKRRKVIQSKASKLLNWMEDPVEVIVRKLETS
ncbi:MAG: DUF354 domain-containing protein [Thaumarchaeota archaeon]|nr:DUF354 domain-containing protein [Nitrososphaerota archaeon]